MASKSTRHSHKERDSNENVKSGVSRSSEPAAAGHSSDAAGDRSTEPVGDAGSKMADEISETPRSDGMKAENDSVMEDDYAADDDFSDNEKSPPSEHQEKVVSPETDEKASPTLSRSDSPVSMSGSNDGVETLITDHFQSITQQLDDHAKTLDSTHFKNYTGLGDLQKSVKHVSAHMSYNEQFITKMVAALAETSKSLNLLNSTILRKIEEEQLQTWLDRPITSQDVEEQAGSRDLMLRAAELRETVASTELQLTNISKICIDMELAAVEAEQLSVQARQAANEAVRRAEEAERAAKEKEKAEEQKRRKAEALAKKQAEEERIRREAEEKRLAESEQLKGTPEEQERLNPNNWPSYTYKSASANDFDGSYCCVIRSLPGILAHDDVTVVKVGQLDSGLPLDNNDELIGNIISIRRVGAEEEEAKPSEPPLEEPLSLLLPHCAPRSTYKDIVVMWRQHHQDVWIPLETKECNVESVKEAKLVECRPSGFGLFAVVHRLRTDSLTVTKRGGKLLSSVDSRLCIQCRPGAFRVSTNFTLQVQPVDLATVSDVKVRFPEECADLISSSPIVKMVFPSSSLNRPINIVIPIPANSAKPKRPMTAVDKERSKPSTRPASAFGLGSYNKEDSDEVDKDGEDVLHMLVLASDDNWYVTDKIDYSPQNKKGDLIAINTTIIPNKFWLLRTKASTPTAQVETLANTLYDYLHRRVVQFIMRQRTDDPTDITLLCTPTQRMDRTIRKLDEEGYTDGTKISQEVFVREGQKVEIRFRGNLQADEEDVNLIVPFNSQLKTQVSMYIAEIDKYAQKSLSCYRGFAQFYVEGMVTVDIYEETDKKKGDQRKAIGTEEVWDTIQLAELLISLPKPEPEAPKPLKRAKLNLVSEGPIDEHLLKELASDLGDEWKMLAASLNVKKTRIQSIMRNHVNSDNETAIYEMLQTWMKRVPRSMDKVQVLCEALRSVGRLDLVGDVRDKEYDFKEMRAEQLRDGLLKQMFVKIAQHPAGLSRWRELAGYLHVSESDLMNIENEYSKGRERCIQALETWKHNQDGSATPNQLLKVVKYLRLSDLTGEIRRMVNH